MAYVSTSTHGIMAQLPGGTSTFFRADGTYAIPAIANDPIEDVTVAANYSAFSDEEFVIADGMELLLEDEASLVIL